MGISKGIEIIERVYDVPGGPYLLRDVFASGRHICCQYATAEPDETRPGYGVLKWHPCIEGVPFTDIEPLLARDTAGAGS